MPERICRTIHQYNKIPISAEDMKKLQEIAEDYDKVKQYVYQRYGGIGTLSKIYPGYTVQNEMTESGLRRNLGLPSVYFYLAVFDALGDIKGQWTQTKLKVLQRIGKNGNLTAEEKHYLRFILKANNAFTAILQEQPINLPKEIQKKYEELAFQVDMEKMHRYLCRQVRRCHTRCGKVRVSEGGSKVSDVDSGKAVHTGFSIAERAYRYGDNGKDKGIFISTKEKRKRIFIPLTDSNQYSSQLSVRLYPKEGNIELKVAVNVHVRVHEDYKNRIGLALGMFTMLTTQDGHSYGEEFGKYQTGYAEWVRQQTVSYNRNRNDNPGRKKYYAKKNRLEEQLHSYINQELNRFLRTEKPEVIYITKLPGAQAGGVNRRINHSVALWQRGYIRKRLEQKCGEHSIELVEVLGKDISNECSNCGALGSKRTGIFNCKECGLTLEEKVNTARNVLKRGQDGNIVK